MTVLSEEEELLVDTIRALPRESIEQIVVWATQLRDLAAGHPVQWSDGWSDEDIGEVTATSLKGFEDLELGQH